MTRTDFLNSIVNKMNYTNYLEIGVYDRDNFDKIICPNKFAVDPSPATVNLDNLYVGTSNEWFDTLMTGKQSMTQHNDDVIGSIYSSVEYFDLVFIDGMHLCENVVEDFFNALSLLSPNGSIVFHDCLPPSEEQQRREHVGNWVGDVWKGIAYLCDVFSPALFPIYDIDTGMAWFTNLIPEQMPQMMYQFMSGYNFYTIEETPGAFTWEQFNEYKNVLFNIYSEEDFVDVVT